MKSYDQRTGVTPKPNEDEVEGQIVLKKIEHFFLLPKIILILEKRQEYPNRSLKQGRTTKNC
jgi:hypothetical protein